MTLKRHIGQQVALATAAFCALLALPAFGLFIWLWIERALATSQGRDALASHPCLHEVFRRGEAFISRVDQACLPDQPGGLPVVTAGGG